MLSDIKVGVFVVLNEEIEYVFAVSGEWANVLYWKGPDLDQTTVRHSHLTMHPTTTSLLDFVTSR